MITISRPPRSFAPSSSKRVFSVLSVEEVVLISGVPGCRFLSGLIAAAASREKKHLRRYQKTNNAFHFTNSFHAFFLYYSTVSDEFNGQYFFSEVQFYFAIDISAKKCYTDSDETPIKGGHHEKQNRTRSPDMPRKALPLAPGQHRNLPLRLWLRQLPRHGSAPTSKKAAR